MAKAKKSSLPSILFFWFVLSLIWGLYRLIELPELTNELVVKPVIWLGCVAIFWHFQVIPQSVFTNLKKNFLTSQSIWRIFLAPVLFSAVYFVVVNFRVIHPQTSALQLLPIMIILNFMTGAVEEFVYHGVLYVWLLEKQSEVTAFVLVQVLFLAAHFPVLVLHSPSLSDAMIHAFFIVVLGAIHTVIFRLNKSLYSSILSHGTWNTLSHYLLLGTL